MPVWDLLLAWSIRPWCLSWAIWSIFVTPPSTDRSTPSVTWLSAWDSLLVSEIVTWPIACWLPDVRSFNLSPYSRSCSERHAGTKHRLWLDVVRHRYNQFHVRAAPLLSTQSTNQRRATGESFQHLNCKWPFHKCMDSPTVVADGREIHHPVQGVPKHGRRISLNNEQPSNWQNEHLFQWSML